MATDRTVRIHLGPAVLDTARAGRHNFLNRLTEALRAGGFEVSYRSNSYAERVATAALPGWSMFEMEPPEGERSLVFRKAYVAPFWQIDRTDKRWDWDVAKKKFRINDKHRPVAEHFAAYWRNRLYSSQKEAVSRDGSIYVPLQARLLEQRPFQAAAPVDMLRILLSRYPGRPVNATLHPKITYPEEELAELGRLGRSFPALTVSREASAAMLARCDCLVTENSAVALEALFFRKPVLLFAGIDFHHACASAWRDGLDAAFAQFESAEPDYDGYLWWYLQRQCLNAGREDFHARAVKRLNALGLDLRVR
ncbi:MAG: hypothetical protein WBA91_01235 [Paracoccaceae bacterium]